MSTHPLADSSVPPGVWKRVVNLLTRRLFYNSYVKQYQRQVREHMIARYGAEFNSNQDIDVKMSTGIAEAVVEDGIYERRVVVPFKELLAISPLTESILIQELIRKSTLREICPIAPKFTEALIAYETNLLLAKQKDNGWKADVHYFAIRRRNEDNQYIDSVKVMDDKNELKPLIQEVYAEISKIPRQERRHNYRLNTSILQRIEELQKKTVQQVKSEIKKEQEYDTLSDEEFIKKIKKNPNYKKLIERDHHYTAEEIVGAVCRGEPIHIRKDLLLSYYFVADSVRNNPGITYTELCRGSRRNLQFGVGSLLSQGTGLDLIERRKEGRIHHLHPTKKFLDLLEEQKKTEATKATSGQ